MIWLKSIITGIAAAFLSVVLTVLATTTWNMNVGKGAGGIGFVTIGISELLFVPMIDAFVGGFAWMLRRERRTRIKGWDERSYPLHSTAHADSQNRELCALFVFRSSFFVSSRSTWRAGRRKYASRRLGWVMSSAGEVGTSAAVLVNSNVRAVVFRWFSVRFHYN